MLSILSLRAKETFSKATGRDFKGHRSGARVQSVGWNASGQKLATGSTDSTARIWTLERTNLRESVELTGHTNDVNQIAWDPIDSERLVTASADKTVRIWDLRSPGKSTHKIETTGANINLAISPDGSCIAVGTKEDVVSFIDPRGGSSSESKSKKFIVNSIKRDVEVNEIRWNYSGDLFFMGTGDGNVQILEYPTLKMVYSLTAHPISCFCIELDPKGRYLATGGSDAIVNLWDLEELACVQTFGRMEHSIRSIGFSYDSEFIAIGSEDAQIDISHVESGEHASTIKTLGSLSSLSWHPSRYLLAYSLDESAASFRVHGIWG